MRLPFDEFFLGFILGFRYASNGIFRFGSIYISSESIQFCSDRVTIRRNFLSGSDRVHIGSGFRLTSLVIFRLYSCRQKLFSYAWIRLLFDEKFLSFVSGVELTSNGSGSGRIVCHWKLFCLNRIGVQYLVITLTSKS